VGLARGGRDDPNGEGKAKPGDAQVGLAGRKKRGEAAKRERLLHVYVAPRP